MTSARITFATIFVLIASALTGQTQWKYRTTNDGEYHIGTNGPNVCVETNSISVTFTVPQGWRISEPKSDETGCKFTAGPNRAVLYLFVPEGLYTCTFEF